MKKGAGSEEKVLRRRQSLQAHPATPHATIPAPQNTPESAQNVALLGTGSISITVVGLVFLLYK